MSEAKSYTLVVDSTPPTKGWWGMEPSLYLRVSSGHYPNWFHRTMQKYLLGIYWIKEEEKNERS